MTTFRLVLLRHGQSEWNEANLFTGWYDADLTELGIEEARRGGRQLREADLLPDVVHTSVQRRAVHTAFHALAEADRDWIPVRRHWRLNERHYGGLQGLNKKETADQYGLDQVKLWRRSYDVPPPEIEPGSKWDVSDDPRYAVVAPDVRPRTECLKDVVARMLPYWYDFVVPDLKAGRVVLLAAHGNSLRALVKHLQSIPDADIPGLEIPTGVPWVFELDDDLRVSSDRWLGDPEAVKAKAEAVAKQAG
jgi:2,3-bisphosphoglycerate-dependent phosphoglycerate mutase